MTKRICKEVFVVVNKHDGRLYAGKQGKVCDYSETNFKVYATEKAAKASIRVSHFSKDLEWKQCHLTYLLHENNVSSADSERE